MKISFDRIELNEIFKKYFSEENKCFKKFDEVLNQVDLRLVNIKITDQVAVYIHRKGVVFTNDSLEIMEQIGNMSDEEHIKGYEAVGLFHDGGDDLDYGKGLVGLLFEVLKKAIEVYKINLI